LGLVMRKRPGLKNIPQVGESDLQESTVYQFHNIYQIVSLSLILHEPPILMPPMPPMPPDAPGVEVGIAIAVLVEGIPDIAIEVDVIIILWSMFIVADEF
jgi:hypothetical protein